MEPRRWKIEYNFELKDKLKKIPKNMRALIQKSIEERLTTNPNEYGAPLVGNLKTFRRLRVGDYRIIYKVFNEKLIVLIIEIENRKTIYG